MWPSALLHAIPIEPGEAGHPALVLALLTLGVAGAVAAGLLLGASLVRRRAAWAWPFGAGALAFLFFDLVKESASLGQGLVARPLLAFGLFASFAVGLLALPLALRGDPANARRAAWVWTAGVALHSVGEGWVVGTEAATADLTAYAGLASFLGHKVIEAMTIPLFAGVALGLRAAAPIAGSLALATLLAGVAAMAGGPRLTPLAFFAAGAGAALYAGYRLLRGRELGVPETAAVLAGVAAVYFVGMLHELG